MKTEAKHFNATHWETRGGVRTTEYIIWRQLRSRCLRPGNAAYSDYGGRGITVCERWSKFENFLVDMGRRPSRDHSLDRRDNDGGYCKENCRWATRSEQARNTRRNHWITFRGESRILAEWAEITGIDRDTITARFKYGWSIERTLSTPERTITRGIYPGLNQNSTRNMKISKNNGGKFLPHPATDEPVKGVIIDVTPLTKNPTPYGEKEQFRIVIESSVTKPGTDERFAVWTQRFTPSLNEKSSLRKFLKSAFAEDVAETRVDEDGELDLDALVLGHPVMMIIAHDTKGDETYANLAYVGPDRSGKPLVPSPGYVRKKDRPEEPRDNAGNGQTGGKAATGPGTGGTSSGTAKVHYGTTKPDWRNAIIPSGPNAGKQLQDMDAQALPVFVSKMIDWQATQTTLSPESEALYLACLEARNFLDKANPDSDIDF